MNAEQYLALSDEEKLAEIKLRLDKILRYQDMLSQGAVALPASILQERLDEVEKVAEWLIAAKEEIPDYSDDRIEKKRHQIVIALLARRSLNQADQFISKYGL